MLQLKDLYCTKIVQNKPVSTCGNGLSHLLDLCANDARSCCRKNLGESCGEKRNGRIPEKNPLRQGRNLRDRIGTGQSTRDARSGCTSLTHARRGCGSKWLASISYRSVARPSLTVNKYYDVDIIRMKLQDVEIFAGYKFEG